MHDKQVECDKARKGHNIVSKTLISLREEVQLAKLELVNVMTQLKNVKDDVARADDLLLKEHAQRNTIAAERELETQITNFHTKSAKLDEAKAQHDEVILKLDREIDEEDVKLVKIRSQYRNIISKKDMISAHHMATEVERQKQSEVMETKMVEVQNAMARYHKLRTKLETAKSLASHLLDEKITIQELGKRQSEHELLLVALERDLSRQMDKNTALTVEIGRPINIHRWRYLQDTDPQRFELLLSIHNLQRKAIATTDKIATKSSNLERAKLNLLKLTVDVSSRQSVEQLRNQLSSLKSELHVVCKGNKTYEAELQQRTEESAHIKEEILKLEEKRFQMKHKYLVSIVGGHS